MIEVLRFFHVDLQGRLSFGFDSKGDLLIGERILEQLRTVIDQMHANVVDTDEDTRSTSTIFMFA